MGCNDFLITIKCDDVHATTYWNDIQDKPDVATKDEIVTEFKTINGQEITGTGNIEISGGSGDIDTSNLVTRDEMYNYPNRNNVEDIYQTWNFHNGILDYGEWIGARYMPQNQSFKTINGESILGDGNIVISGGSGGGDVPSSGTALNVKNGSGWSIQFISSFDYSGLQSSGNIDSQCLYVITD